MSEASSDILESLEDSRNQTEFHDTLFLTPHFLEHFDFKMGGYDYHILESKVLFAGL